MHAFIYCVILLCHVVAISCQRYAERNPLPMDTIPFDDAYDYDYTENYDFSEDNTIFRWNVQDFPQPQEKYFFCNRMKPSFVCDPDNVLGKEEADKLDAYIQKLYNETLCICEDCKTTNGGILVGIALLKHMFQPYNQHPSKTIRSFAERLRRDWKLGACDNDILIVVATTDRLSYTDVGKATSFYVSLKDAHTIFLENKAHFSSGLFYEGLQAMLDDYHKKTRDMKLPVKKELNVGLISGVIIGVILLLGIALLVAFAVYKYCQKNKKDPEKGDVEPTSRGEGVASSWTKQDIKVIFSSAKTTNKPPPSSAKYQLCETEDKELNGNSFRIDDEVIDTTLAVPDNPNETQMTSTTSADTTASEMLDKELTEAVEGIAQTFKPKRVYKGHETDL